MEQSKNKNGKSLDDILQQTDNELTGSWAKLASLIMAYEGIEWNKSSVKARDLLKDNSAKALGYLKEVRAVFIPKQKTKAETPKTKVRREREFMNYRRLLKIAPELEMMLLSGNTVYGKSKVTGYMDFNLELLNQNKRGYYVSISHYYKQNGDMVADPDMVIRVDIEHEFIEALTFQNSITYNEVYDNYMNPQSVKPKEKQSQNAFLDTWLRNLVKQGHQIEFEEFEEDEPFVEKKTVSKEKIKEKESKSEELDLSFMDKKVVSEIRETAEKSSLENIIQTFTSKGKGEKSKMRSVAQYFFIKRLNESSLGVTIEYPTYGEIRQDYEKLVKEQKESTKVDESAENLANKTVIDDSNIAETAKSWTKLASVIQKVEGLEYEKAKRKALELKKSKKAEDYVIRAFNRKSVSGVNQLYKLNYQKLLRLIPSLANGVIEDKSGVIKIKKEKDVLKFEGMESISKTVQTLSIQKVKKKGIQIIAVNRIGRKIWLLSRNDDFDNKSNYDHATASTEDKLKANQKLSSWLKTMLHYNFEQSDKNNLKSEEFEHPVAVLLEKHPIVIEWSEGSSEENIVIQSLEELHTKLRSFKYPKKTNQGYTKTKVWFRNYETSVRIDLSKNKGDFDPKNGNLLDWLKDGDPNFDWSQFSKSKKEKDKVDKKIPDFEVGKVKLVEAHIKAGIDQADIDWINKNKRGLTITPLSNMKNKTKDFGADSTKQALKPGFRISKTGKLYSENRSNRSDLTDGGL
jgi:uncharacterized protein YqiB (DUF1249 family)